MKFANSATERVVMGEGCAVQQSGPGQTQFIQLKHIVDDTSRPTDQPFINGMTRAINGVVRVLAGLMSVVILLGAGNVVWTIVSRMRAAPSFLPETADIFAIFGAFLVVLIAMEIFVNITIYLRDDVIHVNIVMATALMAVARKVIILDYAETPPLTILGLAAMVLAMSVGYWLVVSRSQEWQLGRAGLRNGGSQAD